VALLAQSTVNTERESNDLPLLPEEDRKKKSESPNRSESGLRADPGFLAKQINSAKVGIDEDGFHHHYWQRADAVVVYNEDGVDHVEYLDGELLSNWVEYVDVKRGWEQEGTFLRPLVSADKWRKQ